VRGRLYNRRDEKRAREGKGVKERGWGGGGIGKGRGMRRVRGSALLSLVGASIRYLGNWP